MKKKKKVQYLYYVGRLIFIICILVGTIWLVEKIRMPNQPLLDSIEIPKWITPNLITTNEYSRPAIPLERVDAVVVHYVANPGTTALQNRNFFEGLSKQSGKDTISVSSHFIIGLDGEIIQCIPLDERSYASNHRNKDTVSIECCHPDETGKFTNETYDSLVRLTSWLAEELRLDQNKIIRHYDVTGKICPKYFVEHQDVWEKFLKDVKNKRKEKDL